MLVGSTAMTYFVTGFYSYITESETGIVQGTLSDILLED